MDGRETYRQPAVCRELGIYSRAMRRSLSIIHCDKRATEVKIIISNKCSDHDCFLSYNAVVTTEIKPTVPATKTHSGTKWHVNNACNGAKNIGTRLRKKNDSCMVKQITFSHLWHRRSRENTFYFKD